MLVFLKNKFHNGCFTIRVILVYYVIDFNIDTALKLHTSYVFYGLHWIAAMNTFKTNYNFFQKKLKILHKQEGLFESSNGH